jgi:hypothetical protein
LEGTIIGLLIVIIGEEFVLQPTGRVLERGIPEALDRDISKDLNSVIYEDSERAAVKAQVTDRRGEDGQSINNTKVPRWLQHEGHFSKSK